MGKIMIFGTSGVLMLGYCVMSLRGVEIWPSGKDVKPSARSVSSSGRSTYSSYGSGYRSGK